MARIAIIGGTGFIGPSVARQLAEEGHWVATISRSEQPPVLGAAAHFVADRGDPPAIVGLLLREKIDIVIDLLAMLKEPTRRLLDALDGVVARYVMASSCDVYRNYGGFHRNEVADPILTPMTEDSPLRTSRFPYRNSPMAQAKGNEWLRDYDKIPIEESVRTLRRTAWTILRLPMVFGPGDRQRRFAGYAQLFAAGAPRLEMARGWARWTTTYGYVDNVGAAIAGAATADEGARNVFNVGEPAPADQETWVRRFADAADWNGNIELVKDEDSAMASFVADLDLRFPLMLDTSKIRSQLKFRESVSIEDAVGRTFEYDCKTGWPDQGRP